MYPFGAAKGLDLTGKNPTRAEPYSPGSDRVGSMDLPGHDYGPYRAPSRTDHNRALPRSDRPFHYEDRYKYGGPPDKVNYKSTFYSSIFFDVFWRAVNDFIPSIEGNCFIRIFVKMIL